MSDRIDQKAAPSSDLLQASEVDLDRRELELAAQERGLDARWAGHEERLRVLRELDEYLADREITLRARANRLGLNQGAIDQVLPPSAAQQVVEEADMSAVAAGMERVALIEARTALCHQRAEALAHRQERLAEAAALHSALEEGLIHREGELAEAFRRLVQTASERAARVSEGEPPAPRPREPVEPAEPTCRRQFKRIELSARVDFATSHNFFAGETANISVGGLFVATPNLLQLRRRVRLKLDLPEEGQLEIEGEIMWRRLVADPVGPAGLGIRFLELDPIATAAIERFISVRAPIRLD